MDTLPTRHSLWIAAALTVYAAVVEVAVWAALLPALLASGRWREARERLGSLTPLPKHRRRRLVVHAVSAGEMQAAVPLVTRVLQDDPAAEVLLCTGTRDGWLVADALRSRTAGIVGCRYLPWDRPRRMRRWLAAMQPDACVVIETELWPGLFAACRALDVPLLIVSARLYPRDIPRYAATRGFWAWVLSAARMVLVQDAVQHAAFHRIGAPAARLAVGGNLKFDAVPAAGRPARHQGGRPVIVGASTHHPEERILMAAVAHLRARGTACDLILAPRRIDRAAGIKAAAATLGIAVTVLDRMGALGAALAHADTVFIGGTLARHGGHNIIEAASLGLPCIVGPHVFHIREIVEHLDACGGVVRLPDDGDAARQLAVAIAALLSGPRAGLVGAAARSFCNSRRGAADRAADEIRSAWLPLAVPDVAAAFSGTAGR